MTSTNTGTPLSTDGIYFIDENDEIPDVIPDYGYLDDVTVVSWVMKDIQKHIPDMPDA